MSRLMRAIASRYALKAHFPMALLNHIWLTLKQQLCGNYSYRYYHFDILRNLPFAWRKSNIFIFSHVKLAAKHVEIGRVYKLEALFQQIPLVQNFWNFHNFVVEHQYFNKQKQKILSNRVFLLSENEFLRKIRIWISAVFGKFVVT